MTTHGRVLFDACTLINFIVVDQLRLLPSLYGDRCAWTDGTELEIRRGAQEYSWLESLTGAAWLATPVADDHPPALVQIDKIRRQLGGSRTRPRQHLGEAQAIYHVEVVELTATFATDDRAAYDMARRRGIQVIDTPGILTACHEAGLLACPEAYQLLQKMAAFGRGVSVPPSHWQICPPDGP